MYSTEETNMAVSLDKAKTLQESARDSYQLLDAIESQQDQIMQNLKNILQGGPPEKGAQGSEVNPPMPVGMAHLMRNTEETMRRILEKQTETLLLIKERFGQ